MQFFDLFFRCSGSLDALGGLKKKKRYPQWMAKCGQISTEKKINAKPTLSKRVNELRMQTKDKGR